MIEIKIPKEIRHYKEKLVFGLTVRQALCTFVMLLINVPTYIYGRQFLNEELISWIVLILAIPMALIGFFKYNNMNFESFILAFLRSEVIYPKKRIYETDNVFENIKDFLQEEEISIKKVDRSKKKIKSKTEF